MSDDDADTDQAPDLTENHRIASRLRDYAELLEMQGEDGFRVRAYRRAADEIDRLTTPLGKILADGGTDALEDLKAIGRGIAAAIAEMLRTGRWRQLERVKGETAPEALFGTIPGIGPTLAHRLAGDLDAETLEDLEHALRLGNVKVEGIGPRRREAILTALGTRLGRMRRRGRFGSAGASAPTEPPVSLLLEADALYREKAAAGDLRQIAPKRFNPTGEAWLPILHASRDGWHLTILFSNTARAHELDRIRDWVVIYFHEDDNPDAQRTVVTERQGPLAGRRVVRGREDECLAYYESHPATSPVAQGSAHAPGQGAAPTKAR